MRHVWTVVGILLLAVIVVASIKALRDRRARSYTAVKREDIELSQQAPPYTALPDSDVEIGRPATLPGHEALSDKHQDDTGPSGSHQDERVGSADAKPM